MFNKKQLKMGTEIETEHTDDPKVAKKIAQDHLKEDPNYYDKLLMMEGKGRKHSDVEKKLVEWFKTNPNPTDKQVHALANRLGMNEHELEEIIYRLVSDHAKMLSKSKLVFKKSKAPMLGVEVLKKKPVEETFSTEDAFGDTISEFEEPTMYEECAIEVLFSEKVPDSYSRALHDL